MSLGDSATPRGQVEGLGSAKHGGEHWVMERTISAGLLMLGVWLVASLLFLPSFDQHTLAEWLRAPSGAVPMTLLVIGSFKHALHGLKVVVDDYVHDEGNRLAMHAILLFLAIGGASLALFALGRIAFGSAT